LVEISFPDQISGPPVGCRFAARRVAIFLAIIEGPAVTVALDNVVFYIATTTNRKNAYEAAKIIRQV
jgi:hypothetical protein